MNFLTKLFGKKQSSDGSGSREFLATLTKQEKVSVSNLTPMVYAGIIGEKRGTRFELITDDTNTAHAVPLLRKLEIPDLENLLEAVQSFIKADEPVARGDLAEAARMYRKVIDINPYHDLALMSYGTCLARQGNLREGVKWVEKAVKVNPNNERAKRNLQAMKSNL
jgi:tetratricopeptide (TPR) repeat protein